MTNSDSTASARPAAPALGLSLDIGLPLLGYYLPHGLGASDWAALLTATAVSAVRLGWTAIRRRQLTWFAAMMLAVFGAGVVLAFAGGDARVVLLKDSISTAALAAMFLLSLLGARPVTLSAAQTWNPGRAKALEELYRTQPAARRAFRVSALGWGAGLLAESVLRVPLVAWLPVDWAVGLSTAWMITALVALLIWNAAYISRAARRTPALRSLLPLPPAGRRLPPDEPSRPSTDEPEDPRGTPTELTKR